MIWEFWGLRIQLKASARLSFLKKIHVSTCVKFILVQVLYIHLPAAGHLSTANYSGERERESSNNGMVWEGQLFLDVDLSWHMAAVHVEEGHACNACSCTCTQKRPVWRTNTTAGQFKTIQWYTYNQPTSIPDTLKAWDLVCLPPFYFGRRLYSCLHSTQTHAHIYTLQLQCTNACCIYTAVTVSLAQKSCCILTYPVFKTVDSRRWFLYVFLASPWLLFSK